MYNCPWIPAICENAKVYLGPGNNGPVEFHYDRSVSRKNARRSTICPYGWADANCVSHKLLDFYTEQNHGAKSYEWVADRCQPKRCNYTRPGEFHDNNPTKPKYFRSGVIASCDEFPPASWIQGGVQGGTGAKAICKCFLLP